MDMTASPATSLRILGEQDQLAFLECCRLTGGGVPWPSSLEDARFRITHLLRQYRDGRVVPLVITQDGAGYCGHLLLDRNPPPNHGHASLGIWIDPQHQHRGLGTAAVRLACRDAFAHDAHLQRIDALCLPDNRAMARVLERNGFANVASLPAQQFANGRFRAMDLWILQRPHAAVSDTQPACGGGWASPGLDRAASCPRDP